MALFDSAGRQRIEAAIRDVERTTAGEIVVVSAARCDAYHEVRLVYAAALAMALATVLHLMAPELGIGWLFWLEVAAGALLWLGLNAPPLLRPLLPATRAELRVGQRARLEFLDNRVFDTRDRTGVLIFVSELEHQVVILGDAGIYERLKAEGFAGYVERVIAAIRAGRAADGVCDVIADLGKQLAQQFPPRADDQNELPNAVREPDRI